MSSQLNNGKIVKPFGLTEKEVEFVKNSSLLLHVAQKFADEYKLPSKDESSFSPGGTIEFIIHSKYEFDTFDFTKVHNQDIHSYAPLEKNYEYNAKVAKYKEYLNKLYSKYRISSQIPNDSYGIKRYSEIEDYLFFDKYHKSFIKIPSSFPVDIKLYLYDDSNKFIDYRHFNQVISVSHFLIPKKIKVDKFHFFKFKMECSQIAIEWYGNHPQNFFYSPLQVFASKNFTTRKEIKNYKSDCRRYVLNYLECNYPKTLAIIALNKEIKPFTSYIQTCELKTVEGRNAYADNAEIAIYTKKTNRTLYRYINHQYLLDQVQQIYINQCDRILKIKIDKKFLESTFSEEYMRQYFLRMERKVLDSYIYRYINIAPAVSLHAQSRSNGYIQDGFWREVPKNEYHYFSEDTIVYKTDKVFTCDPKTHQLQKVSEPLLMKKIENGKKNADASWISNDAKKYSDEEISAVMESSPMLQLLAGLNAYFTSIIPAYSNTLEYAKEINDYEEYLRYRLIAKNKKYDSDVKNLFDLKAMVNSVIDEYKYVYKVITKTISCDGIPDSRGLSKEKFLEIRDYLIKTLDKFNYDYNPVEVVETVQFHSGKDGNGFYISKKIAENREAEHEQLMGNPFTCDIKKFLFTNLTALGLLIDGQSVNDYIDKKAYKNSPLITVENGCEYVSEDGYTILMKASKKISSNIVIPNSITINSAHYIVSPVCIIKENAFKDCDKLESITLGNNVQEIGEFAFAGCKNLKQIKLNDSLKRIGEDCFSNCTSLKQVIIPDSVKELPILAIDSTGNDCEFVINLNATSIVKDSELTVSDSKARLTLLSDSKIYETTLTSYLKNGLESTAGYIYELKGDSLSIIEIPDEERIQLRSFVEVNGKKLPATEIDLAGSSRKEQLKEIWLSENIEKISENAFMGCKNLSYISLNDKLKYIGQKAFSGCYNIKKIDLPKSVEFIGSHAFESCLSLKDIIMYNTISNVESHIFDMCGLCTISIVGDSINKNWDPKWNPDNLPVKFIN